MPGILPMVAALARRGLRRVVVASAAVAEARLVEGIEVIGVETLREAVEVVQARREPSTRPARRGGSSWSSATRAADDGARPRVPLARPLGRPVPDLAEVRGQVEARRGLEIALAGGHGLLLIGPPGSGKTLLARTIPGLLPPLDDARGAGRDRRRVGGGRGSDRRACDGVRPSERRTTRSRTPAMVGGGPHLSPGEVTRADQGVLFLDELPEFDRDVLEALRQPMEEGRVAISRAGRATIFPARFQLVAAMNPCPCGFAGTLGSAVRAARRSVPERYQRRVSGPLRDRIDLWIAMPRVAPLALVRGPEPEGSAVVAARIAAARAIARGPADRRRSTAGSPAGRLRDACGLDRRDRAAGRRARRARTGQWARARSACCGSPGRSRTSPGAAVGRADHLDEAAWFRPADMRLAAAEAG